MAEKIALFLKYPYIVETSTNSNKFTGLYRSKCGTIYRLNLHIPQYPKLLHSKIKIFTNTGEISLETIFDNQSGDIFDFLNGFEAMANNHQSLDNQKPKINDIIAKVENILNQIKNLKNENSYKIYVSTNFNRIKITDFDLYSNHFLDLEITDNLDANVSNHSLPDLGADMFKPHGTISSHLGSFLQYLVQMEQFYIEMNILDELCFVVDPINVTTKTNWRIIKIDNKTFIKITINPLCPSSIQTNFIGPSYKVEKLREMFNNRIQKWDIDLNIHENLLRIFDLTFFPLKISNENTDCQNCGICMSNELNQQIPLISCDNERCDVKYHGYCLKKWLETKESKTFFYVTMGTCPFCKEKISTSFLTLFSK